MAISAAVFCLIAVVQNVVAAPQTATCDLPEGLQHEITIKYPGARIVSLPDLGEEDKRLFQKDHGNDCPGLVKVDFYGDGKPTLALVLIVSKGGKDSAELVVAHEIAQKWETILLDNAGSSMPVIWRQGPGKYEEFNSEKKIRATRPVIVFCGYNSWAVLYAWTGTKVNKIWLSD